ncbi:MAG: sigma factor-like helix-turn-helix DNA-binding protein [Longimicrobiales bacterium]|nr:sigma factor-like helix-turn-helix DNA-binding protein [Longimicrobiales bacterium]
MPQADLERSELRWMLRSVLARLPGSRREALLLEQLHGHAYDEISEILEASVSAVKMRVHPARELLQAHIERKIEGANSTDGVTADATRSSSMVEAFRTTFSKRLEA